MKAFKFRKFDCKGQVSMEYLLLVGFVFLITIPLLVLYITYSIESSYRLNANQLDQIARQITDAADSVFYLGEPSQTTLTVNIPNNVKSATVSGNEVVFTLGFKDKTSEIVGMSSVSNMTGTLPITKGIHLVVIKAENNMVNITSN